MGPDLAGVTRRRDRRWLARYPVEPDRVLAEGDPIATALFTRYSAPMPNLSLGTADAASLIEYLESPGDASRKHTQGGE